MEQTNILKIELVLAVWALNILGIIGQGNVGYGEHSKIACV